MSATILSSGISCDPSIQSAIDHAVGAAKTCVARAGIDMQEVDYLIHTGVYRDHNIIEPSIASLIQKGIGLNLDYIKYPVERSAFSFDLMNGNSGVINAFHVADSLLAIGRARHVLITSSDAHPSGRADAEFPYARMGGAILLTASKEPGFVGFAFESGEGEYMGSESFVDLALPGLGAKFDITIQTDAAFEERLLSMAAETCGRFLRTHGVAPGEVALVPSQISPRFVEALGDQLGIRQEARVRLHGDYGDAATSTFALALSVIDAQLPNGDCPYLLFVGASAGLHCGCALYRRPGGGA